MKSKRRLNLGSGQYQGEEYFNIDVVKAKGVDLVWDLNEPLPFEKESVDEILCIHSFEHLKKWRIEEIVRGWYEILKERGRLIIETPSLLECCRRFVEGDWSMLQWIYGCQGNEWEVHYWGWVEGILMDFLLDCGFREVSTAEPQDETRPKEICFRVEAIK